MRLTAARSDEKPLIPFEIADYAYPASVGLAIPQAASGELRILNVDVAKVT